MPATQPRLSREELARRGEDTYTRLVRPALRPEDDGKFVVLDVESGAFEVDANAHAAATRLHARIPGVQAWLVLVGSPTAYKLRGVR